MILRVDKLPVELPREQGLHQVLFRWSPDDFKAIGEIWNGAHPEDGSPLRVDDGIPAGHTRPASMRSPNSQPPAWI